MSPAGTPGAPGDAGRYLLWSLQVDPAMAEPLEALLWESGTLGLELRDGPPLVIEAWFAAGRALPPLPAGVRELGCRTVAEEDWLAPWRRASRPLPLGRRFLVDPREPEEIDDALPTEPGEGRWRLQLPARRAFGTGSHPTTRLMVETMEGVDFDGRSVLDVGCGNGILGFAALLLGAASVVAFDHDPVAPIQARDNARLNADPLDHRAPRWLIGGVAALGNAAPFDVVLVNVLLERIRGDVPALVRHLAPHGRLLASGFQPAEEPEVEALWREHGLEPARRRESEDWLCLELAPRGAPA